MKNKSYVIPYNPKTFEFEELDDKITEYPKDLIAVQFPLLQKLDPVGWNREHGYRLTYRLKEFGVRSHFNAKVVPWEKTDLPYLINYNLKELEKKKQKTNSPEKKAQSSKTKKGRSM